MRKVLTILLVLTFTGAFGSNEDEDGSPSPLFDRAYFVDEEFGEKPNITITASEFASFLQRYSDKDSLFYIFSDYAQEAIEAGLLDKKIRDTLRYTNQKGFDKIASYKNDTIKRHMFRLLTDNKGWADFLCKKEKRRFTCEDTIGIENNVKLEGVEKDKIWETRRKIRKDPDLYKYYCDSLMKMEEEEIRAWYSHAWLNKCWDYCSLLEIIGDIHYAEGYELFKDKDIVQYCNLTSRKYVEVFEKIKELDWKYREVNVDSLRNLKLRNFLYHPRVLICSDRKEPKYFSNCKKDTVIQVCANLAYFNEQIESGRELPGTISAEEYNLSNYDYDYSANSKIINDNINDDCEFFTFASDKLLAYFAVDIFEINHRKADYEEKRVFENNLYWLQDMPFYENFKKERIAAAIDRYYKRIKILSKESPTDSEMEKVFARAKSLKVDKAKAAKIAKSINKAREAAKQEKITLSKSLGLLKKAKSILESDAISEKERDKVFLEMSETMGTAFYWMLRKIRLYKDLNSKRLHYPGMLRPDSYWD